MSLAGALTQLRARKQELSDMLARLDQAIAVLTDLENGRVHPAPQRRVAGRSQVVKTAASTPRPSAASPVQTCGRCGAPGHNQRSCTRTPKVIKAKADDEDGPVMAAELFDDLEAPAAPSPAERRAAELERKRAAGLVQVEVSEEERKRAAAKRVMAMRARPPRHPHRKPGTPPPVGSEDSFRAGRVFVRCAACGVKVMDQDDQKDGHLARAHGGKGAFEAVAA